MKPNPNDISDEPRRGGLECLVAGIRATEPSTVVADHVSVNEANLVVRGDRYDLGGYDDVIVFGGGNAAATVAQTIEKILGVRIRGAVVIDNHAVESNDAGGFLDRHDATVVTVPGRT
ncbi:DUF4147 domain-containing protein [Halococcus agarilyticus]|uniref:DUF4147 domain-containing protein n=1 Tax=Halococcus agarilyticus TaxID=1232219 RepID=UPI000B2F615E|nr:DUF4147 domain-containing protein [Halococcus agarilyticus]